MPLFRSGPPLKELQVSPKGENLTRSHKSVRTLKSYLTGTVATAEPGVNDVKAGSRWKENCGKSEKAKSKQTVMAASVSIGTETDINARTLAKHANEKSCSAEKAIEMMTSYEPCPEYWKDLAEQRREALEDALSENQKLHDLVETLQRENGRLTDLAVEGQKYADLILNALNSTDGTEGDKDTEG